MRLVMCMGLSVDTRQFRMATMLITWSMGIFITHTMIIAMIMAR
jgi:hypothetical protein